MMTQAWYSTTGPAAHWRTTMPTETTNFTVPEFDQVFGGRLDLVSFRCDNDSGTLWELVIDLPTGRARTNSYSPSDNTTTFHRHYGHERAFDLPGNADALGFADYCNKHLRPLVREERDDA